MTARWTPENRARILEQLRAGATVDEALAAVEIPRPTYESWLRKGRRADERARGSLHAQFVGEVDAAKSAAAQVDLPPEGPLSQEDLIGLLEHAAAKGSLRAIDLLLRRPWERGPRPNFDQQPRLDAD